MTSATMKGLILCTLLVYTIHARTVKHIPKIAKRPPVSQDPGKPVDIIKPPASGSKELDLAFIMDSTGSMSSYIDSATQNIREIVEDIVASSSADVRLALIEYRDHAPEDRTFVTRKHDFTNSVSTMKSWLNAARAQGGGDRPEAVADALYQTTKLSWRPEAAKISVLISDAPPHGLVPSEDTSYPDGSPNGHDPMEIVGDLAQMGVTLYVIGCEPSIVPYKDFFMALAYRTGGQYVPLSVPRLLVNAITGGAQEELSLQKFEKDVQVELQKAASAGGPINKQQIATSLFRKLSKSGAKSKQLVRNNKALEGPSKAAKLLAVSTSMADVRKIFKKGTMPRSKFSRPSVRPSLKVRGGISRLGGVASGPRSWKSKSFSSMMVPVSRTELLDSRSGGLVEASSSGDTLSTVESGITIEQINRLVEKGSSKLTKM